MTRVNMGISVHKLTDEHLLAEHREIKRLPSNFIKAKRSGSLNKIPDKFCLGPGHILFFMDKFRFTLNRYHEIYEECLNRGFNVENYSDNWLLVTDQKYYKDYKHTIFDKELIFRRISERILESTKDDFHYKSEKITKEKAIHILKWGTV